MSLGRLNNNHNGRMQNITKEFQRGRPLLNGLRLDLLLQQFLLLHGQGLKEVLVLPANRRERHASQYDKHRML